MTRMTLIGQGKTHHGDTEARRKPFAADQGGWAQIGKKVALGDFCRQISNGNSLQESCSLPFYLCHWCYL